MRFEDERYVRLFTRDTATWSLLSFESRAVLLMLLRKVDRAGIVDLLEGEEVEALASLIQAPIAVVEAGLPPLQKRGTVVISGGQLRLPKFLHAQTVKSSDKVRQQKHRELASLGLLDHDPDGAPVTRRDDSSQSVTERHTRSHGVTPNLAVPSCAVPCVDLEEKNLLQPCADFGSGELDERLRAEAHWGDVAKQLVVWMTCQRDLDPRIKKKSRKVDIENLSGWALEWCLKHQPGEPELGVMRRTFTEYLDDQEVSHDLSVWCSERVWLDRWHAMRLRDSDGPRPRRVS